MLTVPALDWRLYRALALGFLALKLILLVVARPFMDETYYWLWGQHLALGYFDHPPLVGWTQWLASVFGWNTTGLRAFVLLTFIGDIALLYGFARHIAGAAWRKMFRSNSGKSSPSLVLTWDWRTPSSAYSTGSSRVLILRDPSFKYCKHA